MDMSEKECKGSQTERRETFDFYPRSLKHVHQQKRGKNKLRERTGDLFWFTGDAVNTGGPGSGGDFQAKN